MKTIILAGGFGTRLSEYTDTMPKPMVQIGNRPLLWHIMRRYALYGHKEFIVATGYKSDYIKSYFLENRLSNDDFSIDFQSGEITRFGRAEIDWVVTLVDTGLNTMTGGRIKKLKEWVGDKPFFLTYGDGVADVDLDQLLEFHYRKKKLMTVTAVRPPARFGELVLDEGLVAQFNEKPQLAEGWINGGFFVVEPEFLELISCESTMLEREPMEMAASKGELAAYRHEGFWQCMDTKRDYELLTKLWKQNAAPWWDR